MGRINRTTYWLSLALSGALVTVLSVALNTPPQVAAPLILISVLRLHDIGRRAWLALSLLIAVPLLETLASPDARSEGLVMPDLSPAAGVLAIAIAAFLIWLGVAPGRPGANRFGEPPRRGFGFARV
ncbi:MAG: DUF805 domain-containing protein [Pseudomonadota bacterium]